LPLSGPKASGKGSEGGEAAQMVHQKAMPRNTGINCVIEVKPRAISRFEMYLASVFLSLATIFVFDGIRTRVAVSNFMLHRSRLPFTSF
jgi:hypothetical protein